MKKQWQLIRVLMKCGKVGKTEKANSAVGDTSTLISMAIGLALAVGMFFAGRYTAQHSATMGDASVIFTTILTAAAMGSLVMTFMTAVNQLYLSSDLDVLVTMPFTPQQIVTAKMISVSTFPTAICCGLVIPAAIGYFTCASGLSALFIPSLVLGSLLTSMYVVSIVAVVLMIIMRCFKFVRSRNLISVFSTLVIFAIALAYVIFSSSDTEIDEQAATGLFRTISGVAGGLSFALPGIRFITEAAMGNALSLLLAFGVTIAAGAVLMICARTLYFSAALGMTDANGSRGAIKDTAMRKYTAKSSLKKTLFKREIAQILRTPSLITNGYMYSIVFPFILLVPSFVKAIQSMQEKAAEYGMVMSLDTIRELVKMFSISATTWLMVCSLASLFFASMSVALSSLSRYMISREGKDFAPLSAMPIAARTLVTIKRRVVMLFNGISGWLAPSILMIAAGILDFIPLWVAFVGVVVNYAWLVVLVDFCALKDVSKPNLNWEAETTVTKSNVPGVILMFISLALCVASGVLYFSNIQGQATLETVYTCAFAVVPVILAFVCEALLRKVADRLY